jgi:hypothetical protein
MVYITRQGCLVFRKGLVRLYGTLGNNGDE